MAKLVSVAPIPDSPNPATPVKRGPGRPKKYNPDVPSSAGLVDMVKIAWLRPHRLALIIGAIWGGWVPFSVYQVAHYFKESNLWTIEAISADYGLNYSAIALVIVAGGLVYSMSKVAALTELAVGSKPLAYGFTILSEGVMTFLPRELAWLSVCALVLLCAINAVGTGVNLARTSTFRIPSPAPSEPAS